jgi:hypothetical protein
VIRHGGQLHLGAFPLPDIFGVRTATNVAEANDTKLDLIHTVTLPLVRKAMRTDKLQAALHTVKGILAIGLILLYKRVLDVAFLDSGKDRVPVDIALADGGHTHLLILGAVGHILEMDALDAQKDIYDGGVKNLIFIVLNSKQLTDDENRINAVRDSFDNPQNVAAVFLYRTDKSDIAIFVNKTTGAFVVADIENNGSEGNTRIYRYASPEGEELDLEAIKSLVD